MNKIKALLTALLMVGVASPVAATPSYEDRGTIDEHIELLQTIDSLGVTVLINDPLKCREHADVAGYWHGARQTFVLCQERIRRSSNPVWTGEVILASDDDLDTIRHEAHHIVQDCMDGRLDGGLQSYFSDKDLVTFLDGYPDWKENKIADTYRKDGASAYVIKYEIEAWAVADLVPASSISNTIKQICN